VIAVSVLEPVPTARGMVGEPGKTDTKLSWVGIHGRGRIVEHCRIDK
jgi:hypothetical protein